MKTLQTIQKTFNVFRVIVKVAFILCIIGAAVFAVGALCALTQHFGGTVFSLLGEPLKLFDENADLLQKYTELLSAAITLTADAILLGFTHGYLKAESSDGTPFTESGAKKLKKLGIRFIYIPITAIVVSQAIAILQGVKNIGVTDNLWSIITGIVLIIVSIIFRYGSELEKRDNVDKPDEKSEIRF